VEFVYVIERGGEVIYIGRTGHPRQRWKAHRRRFPAATMRVLVAAEPLDAWRYERARIRAGRSRGEPLVNVYGWRVYGVAR